MNGAIPILSPAALAALAIAALLFAGIFWRCLRNGSSTPTCIAIASGITTTSIVGYACALIFLVRGRTDGASSVLLIAGGPLCLGGLAASLFATPRRMLYIALNLPYAVVWIAFWVVVKRFYA
jgi:hypothetical protein